MFNNLPGDLRNVWIENFSEVNDSWVYDKCESSYGLVCLGKSQAYYNKYLTFDTTYHRSVVKVIDPNSKFGLVCNHDIKGALYLIDGEKNTINLYEQYTGDYSIPKVKVSKELDYSISEGSEYLLEVYKTGWKHSFFITDLSTMQRIQVEFDNATQENNQQYCGKGWGSPGVISISGEVVFLEHQYATNLFPKAKVLFIGDSITEGTHMGANLEIENRWCNQLKDKLLNGDALISGRGGAKIDDCLTRYKDIIKLGYTFEVVVILDGMNERDQNDTDNWKVKMQEFYNLVVEQGSTPVICVNPVPDERNEFLQQMRDFIFEKKWKSIRFDYAVSLDGDGVTYDSTFFTDGIHPNKKGQDAMYRQAAADLAEILMCP